MDANVWSGMNKTLDIRAKFGEVPMQPIRQGDVILLPVQETQGQKLSHLTLAEGEVTGHSHRLTWGKAVVGKQPPQYSDSETYSKGILGPVYFTLSNLNVAGSSTLPAAPSQSQ